MLNTQFIAIFIMILTADWYLYTLEDHKISILFPSKPEVQSKQIDSDLGIIKQSTAFVKNEKGDRIEYQLILTEYNEAIFEIDTPETLRYEIQSILLEELKSSKNALIIYQSSDLLKGVACEKALMSFQNQLSLKICLLWNQHTLISLMYYSDYDKRLNKNSERFFNSFRLLEEK